MPSLSPATHSPSYHPPCKTGQRNHPLRKDLLSNILVTKHAIYSPCCKTWAIHKTSHTWLIPYHRCQHSWYRQWKTWKVHAPWGRCTRQSHASRYYSTCPRIGHPQGTRTPPGPASSSPATGLCRCPRPHAHILAEAAIRLSQTACMLARTLHADTAKACISTLFTGRNDVLAILHCCAWISILQCSGMWHVISADGTENAAHMFAERPTCRHIGQFPQQGNAQAGCAECSFHEGQPKCAQCNSNC